MWVFVSLSRCSDFDMITSFMFIKDIFLLIVIVCSVWSCRPEVASDKKAILLKEVKALTSDSLKQQYLEDIYDKDQGVRKVDSEDPSEMMKVDLENIFKIETYLDTYGYPSQELLGEKAAGCPWIVIHHAPDNSTRHKNFHHLYKGYLAGDLSPDGLAFFLGRFQRFENGDWIEFDGPFTTEMEIDTLIKALNLEELALSIEKKHRP